MPWRRCLSKCWLCMSRKSVRSMSRSPVLLYLRVFYHSTWLTPCIISVLGQTHKANQLVIAYRVAMAAISIAMDNSKHYRSLLIRDQLETDRESSLSLRHHDTATSCEGCSQQLVTFWLCKMYRLRTSIKFRFIEFLPH